MKKFKKLLVIGLILITSNLNALADKVVKNDTGIWEICYYVNDFKEPTDKGYITNKNWIKGTFNNSATKNSKLNVDIIMRFSDKQDETLIKFNFYEYGSYLATFSKNNKFKFAVKDRDGIVTKFTSYWNPSRDSAWIVIESDVYKLVEILGKGGIVKFAVKELNYEYEPTMSEYNFTFNANGFQNICKEYIEKGLTKK